MIAYHDLTKHKIHNQEIAEALANRFMSVKNFIKASDG